MNKLIKKLWIKALRSGKFKQATRQLRAGSGKSIRYCCLGVLCELHRRHSDEPGRWKNDAYFGDPATLPPKVQEWAKLDDDNPIVPEIEETLAGMNDDGRDFNYIAEQIERYL